MQTSLFCATTADKRQRLLSLSEGRLSLFLLADVGQPVCDKRVVQRREPEPGTAGLQRGDDLADVVADKAEPGVPGVLLNDCMRTQNSHSVRFSQPTGALFKFLMFGVNE